MKAWDVCMFLLTINAGIWIIQETGVFGNITYVGSFIDEALIMGLVGSAVSAICAAGAKFLSSKITSVQGAAAGAFAFFYGWIVARTITVLASIHVPFVILGVLGSLNAAVLFAAVIEIATGGWRSYK